MADEVAIEIDFISAGSEAGEEEGGVVEVEIGGKIETEAVPSKV